MPNENLQWINERFEANLTNDDLSVVNDFLLIWSLFEKIACNRQANIECLISFSEENETLFNSEIIEPIFDYFGNRYYNNGTETERFQYLRLPNQRLRTFVTNTFINEASSFLDKLKTCLLIVFRFRNNLFHGEKNILTINTQADNFSHANTLLKHLIERKMNNA